MVALRSAVVDSITLQAPWTHRAVLHPHARTATGRVRLTPHGTSRSPRVRCGCTTRVEGGRALCVRAHIYACQLVGCGGWTHACAVTREVFRWEADAPSCTHTLHHHAVQLPSSALPVHAPLPPPQSSVSTLQLHRGCSPSAGGGCHRAAQRCTHRLTVPSTSRRAQTGVCTGASHTPLQVYFKLRAAHDRAGRRCEAQHTRGTWPNSPLP
jgi:hypothetical protein